MDTQNDGPWKRWNPLKYCHFWHQFVRFLGCSKFVKTIGSVQFSIQGSTPTIQGSAPTIQGSTAIPQQRSKPLATKKHVCEESVTIWGCLVSCVFLQKKHFANTRKSLKYHEFTLNDWFIEVLFQFFSTSGFLISPKRREQFSQSWATTSKRIRRNLSFCLWGKQRWAELCWDLASRDPGPSGPRVS